MATARNFASFLLIFLSAPGYARGPVYRCVDPEGRVTLRDERCHARERVTDSVRAGEVPKDFSLASPPAPTGKIAVEPGAAPDKPPQAAR
jgi:hypothetical protein